MLHVFFGSLDNEIYNPPLYFPHQYEDDWIVEELSKQMISDVDRSKVFAPRLIDSPVLGAISPRELSGGVKTLILMAKDETGKVFNASACGDNCAKWILEIAKHKELTVTLHIIMKFDKEPFEIHIMNTDKIVRTFREYVEEAVQLI